MRVIENKVFLVFGQSLDAGLVAFWATCAAWFAAAGASASVIKTLRAHLLISIQSSNCCVKMHCIALSFSESSDCLLGG